MKKKFLLLPVLLLALLLVTGCDLLPTRTTTVNTNTEPEEVTITQEELEGLEKVSDLVFVVEKESLKNEDLTDDQKANIARSLVESFVNTTGTEMTKNFQKYFGKDQTVTYKDINCGIDHGNAEDNVLYKFDKAQDKYVYNDKHPGHGVGKYDFVGYTMKLDSLEIEEKEYHYNMKVLFYGKAKIPDAGALSYGKAYKSYSDASKETNALVEIDNNEKYVTTDYNTGMPETHMDKVMEDVKDKLDTYEFVFKRDGNNLVFQKYSKK